MTNNRLAKAVLAWLVIGLAVGSAQTDGVGSIEAWVTTRDRSALFQKRSPPIAFHAGNYAGGGPGIVVDPRQQMQSMEGFGFALTGGSAELLMKMDAHARTDILRRLFAEGGDNIGVSYLRLSIGASDMNSVVFSYDDLPTGKTDFELQRFDLAQDKKDVIPVLKEILAIAPNIKIMGSPWSAPAWMKTNNDVRGGALAEKCYPGYALYLVKYIQAMQKEGISIDAITIQNEPLNPHNTPSMQWTVEQQMVFLRDHLYPAFMKAGLNTKVILFDHNCDRPDYPLTLLSDAVISRFAAGSGFHHYAGDMSAMSDVHVARPDKDIFFTEQMTVEDPGQRTVDIASAVKDTIIGATRNWSRNVILWNLAADPNNNPHTGNGGCSMCQGAITIDKDAVTRNIAYYAMAHVSKFVRPGSVRIASTMRGDKAIVLTEDEERAGLTRVETIAHSEVLPNVAFRTPEGKIVLIVANDTVSTDSFTVQYQGHLADIELSPGAVGTYIW